MYRYTPKLMIIIPSGSLREKESLEYGFTQQHAHIRHPGTKSQLHVLTEGKAVECISC